MVWNNTKMSTISTIKASTSIVVLSLQNHPKDKGFIIVAQSKATLHGYGYAVTQSTELGGSQQVESMTEAKQADLKPCNPLQIYVCCLAVNSQYSASRKPIA